VPSGQGAPEVTAFQRPGLAPGTEFGSWSGPLQSTHYVTGLGIGSGVPAVGRVWQSMAEVELDCGVQAALGP
jgi:hypothetical protein